MALISLATSCSLKGRSMGAFGYRIRRVIPTLMFVMSPFFGPGVQHFYGAFGLKAELSIRPVAMSSFQLQEDELSSDLRVATKSAARRGWTDHKEQPNDQNAPATDLIEMWPRRSSALIQVRRIATPPRLTTAVKGRTMQRNLHPPPVIARKVKPLLQMSRMTFH